MLLTKWCHIAQTRLPTILIPAYEFQLGLDSVDILADVRYVHLSSEHERTGQIDIRFWFTLNELIFFAECIGEHLFDTAHLHVHLISEQMAIVIRLAGGLRARSLRTCSFMYKGDNDEMR
jgi:hypothetical protein